MHVNGFCLFILILLENCIYVYTLAGCHAYDSPRLEASIERLWLEQQIVCHHGRITMLEVTSKFAKLKYTCPT